MTLTQVMVLQGGIEMNQDNVRQQALVIRTLQREFRARRIAAPLTGPLSFRDMTTVAEETSETPDLISAAKKAAHVAAIAASDMTHRTKAYEKLGAPAFPKGGEMTNLLYSAGTATVVSGCYGEEKEVYLAKGMLEQNL